MFKKFNDKFQDFQNALCWLKIGKKFETLPNQKKKNETKLCECEQKQIVYFVKIKCMGKVYHIDSIGLVYLFVKIQHQEMHLNLLVGYMTKAKSRDLS